MTAAPEKGGQVATRSADLGSREAERPDRCPEIVRDFLQSLLEGGSEAVVV